MPLEDFHDYSCFHVSNIPGLTVIHNIVVDAKLPDHSVLSWQVKVDLSMVAYNAPSQTNLHKVVRKIPNGYTPYMASETCIGKFNELHNLLDSSLFSREMLSTLYQKFCAIVESELITRRVKVKSKFSKLGTRLVEE